MEDKDKIKELEAKLNELTMALLGKKTEEKEDDKIDDYIEVQSVCLSPLYVSTLGDGKGEVYEFEGFGDVQNIPVNDVREIVRHNRKFATQGVFYINNEKFVEKENLKNYYKNIVSAKDIQNMLLCKRQAFGERYSNLSETQQAVVRGLLFDRLREGKQVDEEILFYIHQVSGFDLKESATNFQALLDNKEI